LRAELLPSRQGGTNKDKNVPRYQHTKHDEDKNVPEYERKEHEAWAADKALVLAERLILFRVCPLVVKVKHVLWSAGHRTAFAARGLTHLDPQEISPEPRGRVREEVSCQGASFEGASCEEAPRRERWVDAREEGGVWVISERPSDVGVHLEIAAQCPHVRGGSGGSGGSRGILTMGHTGELAQEHPAGVSLEYGEGGGDSGGVRAEGVGNGSLLESDWVSVEEGLEVGSVRMLVVKRQPGTRIPKPEGGWGGGERSVDVRCGAGEVQGGDAGRTGRVGLAGGGTGVNWVQADVSEICADASWHDASSGVRQEPGRVDVDDTSHSTLDLEISVDDREHMSVSFSFLDPTPYTLHPTPYTLHPTPYTLHPTH
jgi:hypothetical protein